MSEDFVSEVGPQNPFGLIHIPGRTGKVEKSGKRMCPRSPVEGRHHWRNLGCGAQSNEVFVCDFCEERIYD
jgi:hypothetical protein